MVIMRLFNKNFFKFTTGFITMIAIGLLGIVLVGYLAPDDSEEATAASNITETDS